MAPPPESKIDALFSKCDANGDGVISTDEFAAVYRLLMKQVSKAAEEAVEAAKREIEAAAAKRDAEWAAEKAAAEKAAAEKAAAERNAWLKRMGALPLGPASRAQFVDARGNCQVWDVRCGSCGVVAPVYGSERPTEMQC
jgi:hypothetical protein